MSVRVLRLGLSIDERSLKTLEWARKRLMISGASFSKFSQMISLLDGANIACVPLVELQVDPQDTDWGTRIEETISRCIRDEKRSVLADIERLLPGCIVRFEDKPLIINGSVVLRATNVSPFTLYLAKRLVDMSGFNPPRTVSLLPPALLVATNEPENGTFIRILEDSPPMPQVVTSNHLLLIDVTEGYDHQHVKVIYYLGE